MRYLADYVLISAIADDRFLPVEGEIVSGPFERYTA